MSTPASQVTAKIRPTQEQLMALAAQLAAIAAIFRPDVAGGLQGLITIGGQLTTMINAIRTNDPAMWQKVSADFDTAKAGFEASVAAYNAAHPNE